MFSAKQRFHRYSSALWRAAWLQGLVLVSACGGAEPEVLVESVQGSGQLRTLAAGPAAAGTVTVRIRAAGSMEAGAGAQASVRFNGAKIAEGELTHDELIDYVLEVPGAMAGGTLDIVLANATAPNGAALRSLRIDEIALSGVTLRPGDKGTVFDAGDHEAAFDNQGLSEAAGAMTRNGALRITLPAAADAADSAVVPGAVYIDAQRGNDSHPGTIALPWRTLDRLKPGLLPTPRGVFLRCDSVWRASLVLAAPQLQDGTVFAGYGPECATRKATFSGADQFAGNWQKSGATWWRQLPAHTPKITQLFVDGQPLRTAQWPNDGQALSQTVAPASGNATSKTLLLRSTEQAQLVGRDLAGATIQMRTQSWLIETSRVQSASLGKIELETAPAWTLAAGRPYLLQDKAWMLDSPGEFFHDTTTQRLHVISPPALAEADFNTLAIEGTVRKFGLSLTGRGQMALRNLALLAAGEAGLWLHNAPNSRIEQIEASHNGVYGARLSHWPRESASTPGSTLDHSLFRSNGRFGIDAIESQRTRLLRNQVFATGMAAQHQGGVVAGIANGPGGHTEDNRVENSGYFGISFSSLGASRVLRNSVSSFCHRLSDCGAIYTWTGRDNGPSADGALVAGNRVVDAPRPPAENKLQSEIVVGIYIDDHSHGVTVQDNLLAHLPMGIFVHNASRAKVTGNRIWMPSETGLWASMDEADIDAMTGNLFSNNVIVPGLQAQASAGQLPAFRVAQAVWFWHTQAAEAALGGTRNLFTGNTVIQLYGPLASHAWLRGPQGDWHVDTAAWLKLNPAEPAMRRPARFEPLIPQLGEEKIVDGQFDSGTGQWLEYRDPAAGGGSTQWLGAQPGCTQACVAFSAASRGDLLGSQPFSLRPGAPYLYRWTATMPAHAGASVGAPYVSRNGTPWDMMSDARGYVGITPREAGAGETLRFEAYFLAKSAAAARVNLMLETLHTRVLFDAVSVREVLGYQVATPAELTAIALAPIEQGRVFDCTDLGWPTGCMATDLSGQPVSLPLQLPAGGEQYLLRKDSPFRR